MRSDAESRPRTLARVTLAGIYAAAGLAHLLIPGPFLSVTPRWVPSPAAVIAFTGLAELFGAAGLIQTYSLQARRWAGRGLAIYALCVWPANLLHMQIDMARPDNGLGLAYHIPRMLAQPLIIWWALWASGAVGRQRHR